MYIVSWLVSIKFIKNGQFSVCIILFLKQFFCSFVVNFFKMNTLSDLIEYKLSSSAITVKSKYPLTMEEMDMDYGFVLYSATINQKIPNQQMSNLSIPGVRDRAIVFINKVSIL